MPRYNRYLQFVAALLPAGAFGLSVALASNAAKATPTPDSDKPNTDPRADSFSVSAELQAIRDAVDQARTETEGGLVGGVSDPDVRLAYWLNGNGLGWGNGGRVWGNGGWPGWVNVRPWGNGWGNGGWGNGPWRNGGWGNGGGGWGNGGGWHNWHNGGWRN